MTLIFLESIKVLLTREGVGVLRIVPLFYPPNKARSVPFINECRSRDQAECVEPIGPAQDRWFSGPALHWLWGLLGLSSCVIDHRIHSSETTGQLHSLVLCRAYKTPANDFVVCSKGEIKEGLYPKEKPQSVFQSIICCSFLSFPFHRYLFICKHRAKGLEAFMFQGYKHLSTFDIVHMGIVSSFRQKGKATRQSVSLFQTIPVVFKKLFWTPCGF